MFVFFSFYLNRVSFELTKNQLLSPSSSEKKPLLTDTLFKSNIEQNSMNMDAEDIRTTVSALLDAVDALKSISEVRTNESSLIKPSVNESKRIQIQYAERRTTTKQSRKFHLQHRAVTIQSKPMVSNSVPLPSVEHQQSLSPKSTINPLRPLSISPSRFIDILFFYYYYYFSSSI